jgi:hypothetical protein
MPSGTGAARRPGFPAPDPAVRRLNVAGVETPVIGLRRPTGRNPMAPEQHVLRAAKDLHVALNWRARALEPDAHGSRAKGAPAETRRRGQWQCVPLQRSSYGGAASLALAQERWRRNLSLWLGNGVVSNGGRGCHWSARPSQSARYKRDGLGFRPRAEFDRCQTSGGP